MPPRVKPSPPDTDPQSDTQGNRTSRRGRQKSRTAWQASTNRIFRISAWPCWRARVSQMRTRTCCKRIRISAWGLSPLVVLPLERTAGSVVNSSIPDRLESGNRICHEHQIEMARSGRFFFKISALQSRNTPAFGIHVTS